MPAVSIILPVFNGQESLASALDSLISQTFRDFELIVIDDGSTDQSQAVLRAYGERDGRVKLYSQANEGLARTLNRGIQLAQGSYFARMDADDISCPERLARQVAFLDTHPEIGVVGTWVKTIGDGVEEVWRYPVRDDGIRSQLLFNSSLAHPTVVLRQAVLAAVGGYNGHCTVAEDYELWSRLAAYTQFANLPQVLLLYRRHPTQKGAQEYQLGTMQVTAATIHQKFLNMLAIQPTAAELALHEALSTWRLEANTGFVLRTAAWLERLACANKQQQIFPRPAFEQVLAERWWAACWAARSLGLAIWREYWRCSLSRSANVSGLQIARFGMACSWRQWIGHAV